MATARGTATAEAQRRALRRLALLHVLSSVVFGLVALTGLQTVVTATPATGVPWLVAGLGGVVGSLMIVVSAVARSRAVTGAAANNTSTTGAPADSAPAGGRRPPRRLAATSDRARLLMVATAVVTGVLGVWLAPIGLDRGFSIGVSLGLAGALALFALLTVGLGTEPRPTR